MGLIDDLLHCEAWGPNVEGPVELIVTHASWVFLARREVFKVKRPVNLGFLDFTTLAARRTACEAEVALNSRLAPGIYLGVVPLICDARGRHRVGDAAEAVDWAVHMVRLDDAVRGDQLLARAALTPAHLERLATCLGTFHAGARQTETIAAFGQPSAIARNVEENFAQAGPFIEQFVSPAQAREVERFQRGFLERRAALFTARAAAGRVRDGHGDLRLEHVYFEGDGAPRVIDCIEFNDRFRYGDVCADIAFLAMDLAWHGRVDLAELFVARYARASNDFDLYAVLDFYVSYRAWVRAKVAGMLAADPDAPEATRARAASEARRYFLLALAEGRPPLRAPRVIAIGGLIATGKSTVAEALEEAIFAPIVDADRTRKALLGVAPTERVTSAAWVGAYGEEMTRRTYAEVLRRAMVALEAGRSVILDASFRAARWRRLAKQLAVAHGVPFLFVECTAPAEVCKARLRQRAQGRQVSDARVELFADFVAQYEPVTELAEAEHLVIDTSGPLVSVLTPLRARLGLGNL